MKKIYSLFAGLLLFSSITLKAQDTLLFESFQFVMDTYLTVGAPSGNNIDAMWYNFDVDQLADGSGSANPRSDSWFQSLPYADADLYLPNGTDTNIVMASNSWFTSPGYVNNWLITNNIQLGAHDTLFWKSAPRQTPRYLDGYEVLLSTTTNDNTPSVFSHTLFTAAEMDAILGTNDSVFSGYSFTPASAFIHGIDGTYTENQNDSARLVGVLRSFSVPLDAYGNQNVFIAFHHNCFDDNLISVDDIMIRGDASNPNAGVGENNFDLALNVFPNPSHDNAQLNFTLTSETSVSMNVYDVTGKLVYSDNKGVLTNGRHFANINTSNLSKGFYTIAVQTNYGRSTTKLIVQ